MKVKWGWDDGYVGGRRDEILEIPDEDLEGMTEREIEDYIDEEVKQAFADRVTYYWKKI